MSPDFYEEMSLLSVCNFTLFLILLTVQEFAAGNNLHKNIKHKLFHRECKITHSFCYTRSIIIVSRN
jgi:hypothetical protein